MAAFGLICLLICIISLISVGVPKKHNYIFNNEYATGISGNTSYLRLNYFKFDRYNRTVKAANVEFDWLGESLEKNNDVDLYFEFFIFKSNQYRRTPIMFPAKFCDVLGTNRFDVPNITKNSTLQKCPIHKGHHYLYNIVLTSNGWPNALPKGRFKIKVDFSHRKETILIVEWFLEITSL